MSQPQPQQSLEQSTPPPATPTDEIVGTTQQEEGTAGLEPDEPIRGI